MTEFNFLINHQEICNQIEKDDDYAKVVYEGFNIGRKQLFDKIKALIPKVSFLLTGNLLQATDDFKYKTPKNSTNPKCLTDSIDNLKGIFR